MRRTSTTRAGSTSAVHSALSNGNRHATLLLLLGCGLAVELAHLRGQQVQLTLPRFCPGHWGHYHHEQGVEDTWLLRSDIPLV